MRCSKGTLALFATVLLAALAGAWSVRVARPQSVSAQAIWTPPAASQAQQPPSEPAGPQGPAKPPENENPPSPQFVVVIDPGHGGDDQGAALGDKLAEKDVTLALAKRLNTELQEKGIATRLLREGDMALSLEQRAELTNAQHGAVYLALHAGTPGGGIRIYAPALTSAPSATSSSGSRFLVWDQAQARYLARSHILARAVAAELHKKDLPVATLNTPLRPLNSIAAPAVAVELAPEHDKVQEILGRKFQSMVVAGIASALLQSKAQLERTE